MSSSVVRQSRPRLNDQGDEGAASPRLSTWILLWVVALSVRLGAAFYLPNAEQDGYSDAEMIARLSANLAGGHFRLADLYGFWLPLFQFVAAVPNIWLHDPLLSGKILSSLCGAASCILVFAIARHLTQWTVASVIVYGLVLLNPLHLLYSAACMTDVPFGCLILASLWFLLKDRWWASTVCAALAGAVRVEAWALIPLLPVLQFMRQRRISLAGCALLAFPPLGWLLIGRLARGDWFAFFVARAQYHARYVEFHPSRHGFAAADVLGDLDYLLLGANRMVFLACMTAALLWLIAWWRRGRFQWPVFAILSYFFSILGLLVLAYATKRQPVWLPRYGLFALVLGLPLVAWLMELLREKVKPAWLGWLGMTALVLACAEMVRQLPMIPKVMNDFQAQAKVADALVADLAGSHDGETRIFSDDVAVRVLSRLPASRFLSTFDAPAKAWDDASVFAAYLQAQRVGYVVFMSTEDSLPVQLYPELAGASVPADGRFHLLTHATSTFGPDVWLYRWRD
jgi:hypothetical protein